MPAKKFRMMAICLAVAASSSATAARFVPVRVFVDGELILSGNASDNGYRDADEVWDALKKVNLEATDAFKKLVPDTSANTIEISKKQAEKGKPQRIRLNVAYGGLAETAALHLERQPPDGAGRVWRISADDVDRLFNSRLVRREQVTRLKNPKQKR